jgi:hypothetical protein
MKKNVVNTPTSEQHAMLDELESIKELLLKNSNEFDIPTLDHPTVESAAKEPEQFLTNDIPVLDASSISPEIDADIRSKEIEHSLENQPSDAELAASKRLDQQQNLFQEFGSTATIRGNNTVKARGENPFLPKHIRDRLHADQPVLPNNIIHPLCSSTTGEIDKIIDDLVSEFLPEIEVRLRSHLKPLIEQQLQQGPSEEP